ncbi:N-acetylmuramic acid 6-phosphate etherase [candidate division KSB1 bacterium]|nr:N-acetylmuramic acid 6-phosphate etherase [candidate division KSB1 bacterium]
MLSKTIFDEIKNLVTEKQNEATMDIDKKSVRKILEMINDQDKNVPLAVEKEIPYIEKAVHVVVHSFKNNGRFFYVGAGTSGRLGVLDASECPPTFGVSPELVQGIIAGGNKALIRAQEGAEDLPEKGAEDLLERGFTKNDVLCGIAASRRTPYVIGAIDQARKLGAKTLYVTCTPRSEMNINVDVAICPVVGPEVIMGSTRLKAGTATKLVLNMITTTSMIRLGKVYGNMMVDLLMTSKKLQERSKRIVMMVSGLSYDEATDYLEKAGGHVKTALVMILAQVDEKCAKKRLKNADGFIYKAIKD